MTRNTILIGPDTSAPLYRFDNSDIREITGVVGVDIVGSELSVDQLTPKVGYDIGASELWTPSDYDGIESSDGYLWATNREFDDIRKLTYGEVVRYYHGGDLAGKFYIKNVDRISKDVYQINAMSAVGLLDAQRHYGGIYTGKSFLDVATEIIGGAVNFTCDANVASVTIFGWLPIASKRKNLHQLLFATGTALVKDENGDIKFVFLSSGEPTQVPDNRIYMGGNVDYSSPASAVEVTEHAFYTLDSDETVTLFDNTDGSGTADNTLVSFQDAPVHDLAVDGNLTIVTSGVNYAIVTGTGVLTGKKYTHTSKVIRKEAEAAAGEENVVTVTDATLVSVANSENVAERVLSYYSSKKTVGAAIVLDGETAGQQIAFNDPYDEASTGFLATMEINVSSNLKAQCTIITDYVPTGQGNNYSSSTILSGTGTFTVGEGGAMAILIGGGNGGYSGGNGANGEPAQTSGVERSSWGPGGEGGDPGPGGTGGRIYAVTLEPGTYSYDCGVGGDGGVSSGIDPTAGGVGSNTTISQNGAVLFSSESGVSFATGFLDIFSGNVYALHGSKDGVKGGKGGTRDGANGESVTYQGNTWAGGSNGPYQVISTTYQVWARAGGGAAVGANGEAGSLGPSGSNYNYGGSGGSAKARDAATVYGNGGDGGHGGGGGGGSGGERDYAEGIPPAVGRWSFSSGSGGTGGTGGDGGDGAPGCIIIYSNEE